MAKFQKHKDQNRAKVLVVGASSSGKTSLIASVANAGYRTCILDSDNGLDVLNNYLTDKGRENLHFITLADDLDKKVSAWGRFHNVIREGWKDDDEDLGRIQEWGQDTVLVLDTLNFLGKAAMRAAMAKDRKPLDSHPELQHWGEAGRWVESRIDELCSGAMKFHLIVNTHLKPVEDSIGRTKFWPACVGSSLPQDIGAYFNTLLRIDVKTTPKGDSTRVLRTMSDNKMDLKVAHAKDFDVEVPMDLVPFLRVYEAEAKEHTK